MIRVMRHDDIQALHEGFKAQGWHKPVSLFEGYLKDQETGIRTVWVAEKDGRVLGYGTLLHKAAEGPFAGRYPMIIDLNVLQADQGKGTGTALMAALETQAKTMADAVVLALGMHPGYGHAQRLYVKRGYVPDGSGLWYQGRPLPEHEKAVNDDDLVLHLIKDV
ncbi:MAG: GNAT family N-acetyltransferase [Acholeplasmataceae bacterium]|nr:MAG: GNAT family N-acetyltransferase [Acholeplasmataceae bacterium]